MQPKLEDDKYESSKKLTPKEIVSIMGTTILSDSQIENIIESVYELACLILSNHEIE